MEDSAVVLRDQQIQPRLVPNLESNHGLNRNYRLRLNLVEMNARFQAVVFLIYGAVLCMTALYLAGFGHGSYMLLALIGAPLSLLGVQAACFAGLLQWSLLPIVQRKTERPLLIIGLLIAHHVSAGFAIHRLSSGDPNLEQLRRTMPGFTACLFAGLIWYLVGQIWLWVLALKGLSPRLWESSHVSGE